MRENQVSLFFPPTHDFAMPYLALPLLKDYVERYCGVPCGITDINLQLYMHLIGIHQYRKKKNACTRISLTGSLMDGVEAAIDFEDWCLTRLQLGNEQLKDYKLSLRKLTPKYDATSIRHVYEDISNLNSPLTNMLSFILRNGNYNSTKLFGISVCVEDQMMPSFALARAIRIEYPNTMIVMGGNIITRLSETIKNSPLREFFDFLVVYEGEEPFAEIVNFVVKGNCALNNQKIIHIPHNTLTTEHAGISQESPKLTVTDLDNIHGGNFADLALHDYLAPNAVLPIFLGRKCYWGKCDFCSIHSAWDAATHRQRKLESVVSDLKSFIDSGVHYFRIVDEDCHPELLERLSRLLFEANLEIYFEAYSRFEPQFTAFDFCRRIAQSGCTQLFFGLESIGRSTLRLIGKGSFYSNDNVTAVLNNTGQAGILNYVFVLIGIPGASIDDERETVSYIINNTNIHAVALGTFVVDRASPIHLNATVRAKYPITLIESQNLTTEVNYLVGGQDIREDVQLRGHQYICAIFDERPDLALSFLLNEETRLILGAKHGNIFCFDYIRTAGNTRIKYILGAAKRKAFEDRIARKLNHKRIK